MKTRNIENVERALAVAGNLAAIGAWILALRWYVKNKDKS